jgi:GTP cyclohydrolase I
MNKPTTEEALQAINIIMRYVGEDVLRPELKNTPLNIISGLKELFSGYDFSPEKLSDDLLDNQKYNQLIIMDNIKFTSFCEHHALPFTGNIKIGYLPSGKIIGFGKIIKIIEACTKKLQLQERLTFEIASLIEKILQPKAVGVRIKASHSCISMRNSCQDRVSVKTNHLLGELVTDQGLKSIFFNSL